VTDRNGELLGARIADDEQWRFPTCDTVPEKIEIFLIAFEDRYYRYHWGVNPLSIGRAVLQNIKEKRISSGGSTISMQVIRLSRNKKRTIREKIVETILATRLEFRYSKAKILALYASHAPFGGNVVGLDAAAWRYFGHPADKLSWAESATLAVLPNAPAMLHLSKNRQALLEKRNRLLKRLFNEKKIDQTTYDLAIEENLPDEPIPLPQIAPHLVSRFHQTHKGENCLSTLDKSLQIRVENILERWNFEFRQSDIQNMAVIVMDVKTNQTLAYCGNVRFNDKNSGNQVDVIQADRSTGSILKPFLYHAALQEGEILPYTLLPDIPVNINGFSPQNFNRQFEGAVPADKAVARSLNIPLVSLLRMYSVPKLYDFLKQNKIAALPRPASHYGLSLILGGAEAKLGDVANAYSNMARTLLGLESTRYGLLLEEKPEKIKTTFQAGAVWQVFDAIKEVNRPEEIDWRTIPSIQKIAWKTGTSYGFRDAWAVGVTPKYVVGVWVGNASGEGKPNLVGARTAGPVMFDIFNILPSSQWFSLPYEEFIEAEICRQSGCLKGRFCEETDTILILPNGLHTESCPYHIQVNLSADGRYRVYENCANTDAILTKSWFVLPPAWAWYYKQYNPSYQSLPPFKPGCGEDNQQPMQFIYPQNNSSVHLPKQLDGKQSQITFELAHSKKNATVFWHIDNEYISSTNDFHTLSVKLSEGKHAITVVDDEGNTLSCRVEVE
jgi:penicillin-binding protein 1C